MKSVKRKKRACLNGQRSLCLELLEQRRLLAIGAGPADANAHSEAGAPLDGTPGAEATLPMDIANITENHDPTGLKPVGNINPAVSDPWIDHHTRFPEGGVREELEFGLPDEINPDMLPGHGCPNGQGQELQESIQWDISFHPYKWDFRTVEKVVGAGAEYGPDPFDPFCTDFGEETGDGADGEGDGQDWRCEDDETVADGAGDIVVSLMVVSGDDGSGPDAEQEDEPEGDEPDEFRFDPSQAAFELGHHCGPGGSSDSGYKPSTADSAPPWTDPDREPTPLPEDGRPEETPVFGHEAAIDMAIIAGYAFYPGPEPGDPDDPDDPRAIDSAIGTLAVSRAAAMSGVATPPPDDVPGKPLGPQY